MPQGRLASGAGAHRGPPGGHKAAAQPHHSARPYPTEPQRACRAEAQKEAPLGTAAEAQGAAPGALKGTPGSRPARDPSGCGEEGRGGGAAAAVPSPAPEAGTSFHIAAGGCSSMRGWEETGTRTGTGTAARRRAGRAPCDGGGSGQAAQPGPARRRGAEGRLRSPAPPRRVHGSRLLPLRKPRLGAAAPVGLGKGGRARGRVEVGGRVRAVRRGRSPGRHEGRCWPPSCPAETRWCA